MAAYNFRVNGRQRTVESWDPNQPLLYVLRGALGLHAAKFGCGLAQCGACTVLVDGEAAQSCALPVSAVEGKSVTTLESLGSPEHPDRLQAAFIAEQATQCGYCANGMIMQAKALLAKNPRPTADQVKEALAGNLCRCGTYTRVVRAVQRAAQA